MKYIKKQAKLNTILTIFVSVVLLLSSLNYTTLAAKKSTKKAVATKKISAKKTTKKKKRKRKARRTYNKAKTKAEALEIIKTSEEVSEIAGVEATPNPVSGAYVDTKIEDTSAAKPANDVELLKQYLNANDEETGEEGENLAELEAEDDVVVDLDDFHSVWLLAIGATGNNEDSKTAFGINKEELMETIINWFGTPYRFGGVSNRGIDCSAWVQTVFQQTCSIVLPRTAREQINVGRRVKRDKLEFGDLVFFYTYSRKFASHVGIYLGDDLFAHASSRKGVTVSSLRSTFYNKRFICGNRFSKSDIEHYKIAANSGEKANY